jgi:hypothetical protein
MADERTAPVPRITEHRKARWRPPLFVVFTVAIPSIAGVDFTAVWVMYVVFALLYSLWTLRLTTMFARDRRLGYVLCVTDAALLLPLLVWNAGPGLRVLVVLAYGVGLVATYAADRGAARVLAGVGLMVCLRPERRDGPIRVDTPAWLLDRAIRTRLGLYARTGTRFALVVVQVLRFEEMVAYYGRETAERTLAVVGRRGLRQLGPDAQRFPLDNGRIVFVFEIEGRPQTSRAAAGEWSEPYDVEGMAMQLARKTCEHLIEGRRVECVVGWASAPADGLDVTDLLRAAESGTRSAEAFRHVRGSRVAARVIPTSGPSARHAAAPSAEEIRTAVG